MVPGASCYQPPDVNRCNQDVTSSRSYSHSNSSTATTATTATTSSVIRTNTTTATTATTATTSTSTSSSIPLSTSTSRPHWDTIHVRDPSNRSYNGQRPSTGSLDGSSYNRTTIRNSTTLSLSTRRYTTSPYLLSVVAKDFMQRMVLNDRLKDGIEYKNVFDGQQAVVRYLICIHICLCLPVLLRTS